MDLAEEYKRVTRVKILKVVLLFLTSIFVILLFIGIGSKTLSLHEVLNALIFPHSVDPGDRVIVWQIRMPSVVTAILTGLTLSLSGLLMQITLNNPLAEPFTFGVSSAAGFGAALAIVFAGWGILSFVPLYIFIALVAFFCSMITILLIGIFASRFRVSVQTITLLGVGMHFIFSALLSLMQYLSSADQLQALVFWLLGSITRSGWNLLWFNSLIFFTVFPMLLMLSWKLTAIKSFGEKAVVLGVNVEKMRFLMLILSALMASTITAVVGIIGFVGLVAPHMARYLVGEDQRFSIIVTALCGVIMVVASGLVGQILIPGAIVPIGIITAILGVPFFVSQIVSSLKRF